MANTRNKPAVTSEQSRPSPPQVLSTDSFNCPLCSAMLKSRPQLLHHVSCEHRESFFAVCKTCMQCFSPKDIDAHITSCKGPCVCPYCHQTFAILPYLNRHIKRKHSIVEDTQASGGGGGIVSGCGPRYACKFCSRTYSSNSSLNTHIRKHLSCDCKVCGSRLVREAKTNIAMCGACGNHMTFNDGVDENCESAGVEAPKSATATESTGSSTSSSSSNIGGGKSAQFTCPYCQRLYVSLTCFRKHLATHAPSRPLQPVTNVAAATTAATPSSTAAAAAVGASAATSGGPTLTMAINETTGGSSGSGGGAADYTNTDFFQAFTEEDWMQADTYLCLSPTPNINLLYSILYEGASTEFL